MPSYFYAVTHLYRLCGHVFMQLRIYTAYAATLLCSPFMRSCFCAVMLFYADEAFTQSRFYAAEPFTQAHFTQLRPLHGDILIRPHSYAAALFMQPCFYAVLDGNGSQGNGSEVGSLGDGPAPVRRYGSVVPAGPLLSRQAEGDGTPAVFSTDGVHGALQLLLLFLLPGDHRGL